ncbi:hypothetical protein RJ641_009980 [Dillenia turbinata]|uniref:Uncharacterized protein n=1 Tax=Dillenia turbinata TaxID=194707 RepID=A0AAN8UXN2_9MAGN
MESLRKLEDVQRVLMLMKSKGTEKRIISSNNTPDSERFLAHFILFLMQPCGALDMDEKCHLISENLPRISTSFLVEVQHWLTGQGCQPSIVEDTSMTSHDNKSDPGFVQSHFEDLAMVELDAMQRANSTLEDFCRSYFMFHDMDVNTPQSVFKYLPVLSFTESYIYQLDSLNEKMMHVTTSSVDPQEREFSQLSLNPCDINQEAYQKTKFNAMEQIKGNPFEPLVSLLEHHGLLTKRMEKELRCGEEYWALERKLCHALVSKKEVQLIFDGSVTDCRNVNDLHMNFLSISEFLVEDDVLENSFNILRMFVRVYGASKAQIVLVECITDAEEKYQRLLKTLDPKLASRYQRRCEEATMEGGNISGYSMGTWSFPPVIEDEDTYRSNLLCSKSSGGGM